MRREGLASEEVSEILFAERAKTGGKSTIEFLPNGHPITTDYGLPSGCLERNLINKERRQ
jgi:hypothetical protein